MNNDANFDYTSFGKDIGRLEAAGENMKLVAVKVDQMREELTTVKTRQEEYEKANNRKLVVWGILGPILTALAVALITIKWSN